ncbi:hypothetical protein LTR85_008406 [Meristemomyces frigidus]|nr:hypothetical protein LTR85_008406 [Meristemomyces frigidus]
MYGLGFLIFYYPILSMVDEYWIRRRGMAYGLLCSASGASGTVMPLVMQALLRKYGYPTTLRATAVVLLLATGPLIPMLKGRLPVSTLENSGLRTDWSFMKKPLFWVYNLSNLIQGLGYFFPSLFLPSFATSIGLNGWQGALLLTVMSISQVLGQFTFGYLSDRRRLLPVLMAVSTLVSATATFSLWGVSRSFPPLLIFAMLFGFFGAGYTALWGRMVSAVSEHGEETPGQSNAAQAQAMFSCFCFGKGVGNVLAGPISAGLISNIVHVGSYGALKYKAVVVFTGVSMLLSAISIGPWHLRPKRHV